MPGAWFETIFDERYPELFGPPEGKAEKEVEEIIGLIAVPPGSAVEDLGCGRGRHAVPLARRGYVVPGQVLFNRTLATRGGRTAAGRPRRRSAVRRLPATPVPPYPFTTDTGRSLATLLAIPASCTTPTTSDTSL